MKLPKSKFTWFVILLNIILIAIFVFTDVSKYFQLDYLKSYYQQIVNFYKTYPVFSILIYFTFYTFLCSMPVAKVFSIMAGAVFGSTLGTILSSVSSTIGAALVLLVSRHLFYDWTSNKFPKQMNIVKDGFEKDGLYYLASLRLIPLFPFFIVNILMGLTPIKTWSYLWVSWITMLPATFIYVNAGRYLSEINSVQDIFTTKIMFSFALLGAFPLVIKFPLAYIKKMAAKK